MNSKYNKSLKIFGEKKKSIYRFQKKNKDEEDIFFEENIFWLPSQVKESSIKIYDHILESDLCDFIFEKCKDFKWIYQQKSIGEGLSLKYKMMHGFDENQWPYKSSFTFFKHDKIDSLFFYELFYKLILPKLECIDRKRVTISRLYFNTHTPGICGLWHKDGKVNTSYPLYTNAPTVLLYLNKDWSIDFDGTTSFMLKDNDPDSVFHVDVKHGRVVVFPSNVSHRMNDVSYYTLKKNILRFVVAYHLQYDN